LNIDEIGKETCSVCGCNARPPWYQQNATEIYKQPKKHKIIDPQLKSQQNYLCRCQVKWWTSITVSSLSTNTRKASAYPRRWSCNNLSCSKHNNSADANSYQ